MPGLKGKEREEAIEKLEAWLKKVKRRGASRGRWKTVSGKKKTQVSVTLTGTYLDALDRLVEDEASINPPLKP